MKKIILTVVLFLSVLFVYGQTRSTYTYDASGNRIGKKVIQLLADKSTEYENEDEAQTEETIVYSEFLQNIKVNIYPNPTKGRLTVELNSEEILPEVKISVYNMNGQRIHENKMPPSDYISKSTVDLTGHKTGMYVMKIETGNYVSEWKIIKQ